MDYLYENLGDERFQEFCQTLINKEFPNTQSFPVGQPDGGRDSVVYIRSSEKKEFIVFQVKYVRNPYQIQDIHKWLSTTIENEKTKIANLIPHGATSYYLLTNVKGTAHLDVGSIDKVNKILEDNISIPTICWWRDDLSRKFETDVFFKWSFPEIVNGQDFLNKILFDFINENKERRESVVKAYLADQYRIDNEVKFKQIDLQNRLLNLFTDVPIQVNSFNKKNISHRRAIEFLQHREFRIYNPEEHVIFNDDIKYGAAEFLLNANVQNTIEKILLQGGPGQGKSTISQYVCQVHRIRMLDKKGDLTLLPDKLKSAPVRLPFKFDLRHIASWVENKNPYQDILSDEYFKAHYAKSLESFIIFHIQYHSNIKEFSSNDFISICKISPVLFVFDGFDEIANFKVRQEVIEFINRGVHRIKENAKSIQVLITSRPAAFSDSVGFSVNDYPHFELGDITPATTSEYVERWVRASNIESNEGHKIKRLVEEKLKLPHLRELAKSPMQLAIFISLLRTRGESLPNKRTALYDSYIELFFNRESEKDIIIRDNRDLIIDIHRYLAWILHSEAELYQSTGSIRIDDLKAKLKDYLVKEGHKTDIADTLFDVMKERVCALVSRVQGTFEFEVQPLREYFCARYLYNTAPYSPVGKERKGTKPDRFSVISKSFYWQNVVRFFAGCFDKGELPMLISQLQELKEDNILKFTNYPRILTSQILSDYVFTQYPKLLEGVIKIIIDGINIRNIINQGAHRNYNDPISLPNDCGRKEVAEACVTQLKLFPKHDYSNELIGLLNNNSYKNLDAWLDYLPKLNGKNLTTWLEYAYRLELIHIIPEDSIISILDESESEIEPRLQLLIHGNRYEFLDKNIKYKELVLKGLLNLNISIARKKNEILSLELLYVILNPFSTTNIFLENEQNVSLLNFLGFGAFGYNINRITAKTIDDLSDNDPIDKKVKIYFDFIKSYLEKELSYWKTSIEPWDEIIEKGKEIFADNWIFIVLATLSAGIKSKEEKFIEFDNLNDNSLSICKRVRCARMKSGDSKYWNVQITTAVDLKAVLLVFFTWATPKVIIELLKIVDQKITELNSKDYLKITKALVSTTRLSKFRFPKDELSEFEEYLKKASDKIKYLVSYRINGEYRHEFIFSNIKDSSTQLKNTLNVKLEYMTSKFLRAPDDTTLLRKIKDIYGELGWSTLRSTYNKRSNEKYVIPIDIAKKIMAEPNNYPRLLASLSEKACRIAAQKELRPVAEIAASDSWFD